MKRGLVRAKKGHIMTMGPPSPVGCRETSRQDMYLSHQVQNATLVLPEQNRPGISYPKLYPRQLMELQEKQGKVCGGTLALGLSLHCQTPTPAKPESVCHPSPGTGHPKLQRSLPPTAPPAPALSVGNDRK